MHLGKHEIALEEKHIAKNKRVVVMNVVPDQLK